MRPINHAKVIRDRINDLSAADDPRGQKRALADALEVHPSHMSRMLKGTASWPIERYLKAVEFLGLTPQEAFGEIATIYAPTKGDQQAMAQIYNLVSRFKNPAKTVESLRRLKAIEDIDKVHFEKIMGDIDFLYQVLSKNAQTATNYVRNAQ
jgi:hypothetical protein